MIIAVLAAAILMSQAAPPASEDATDATDAAPAAVAPPATAAKGPKADRDHRICHNERVSGSRFPQKVCYSQAEADDRAQQDRDALNRLQVASHSR
jgi:hypothetical protein